MSYKKSYQYHECNKVQSLKTGFEKKNVRCTIKKTNDKRYYNGVYNIFAYTDNFQQARVLQEEFLLFGFQIVK